MRALPRHLLGPFIREKIRRDLYRLCDRVLHKTRRLRINDPRLIFDTAHLFTSYLRRVYHLYEEVHVLFKTRPRQEQLKLLFQS